MISIIESYINFGGEFVDVDLKAISNQVLEIIESKTLDTFSNIDLEYEIHIEEGSLKLRTFVKVTVNALIIYGGLRGAIQFAYSDAQAVSKWFSDEVKILGVFQDHPVSYSRSDAGDLDRIRKLLEQADAGLITQKDAIKKASKILNISTVNENQKSALLEMISSEFKNTPKQINKVSQQADMETSKVVTGLTSPHKRKNLLETPEALPVRRRKKRFVTLTKDSATGAVTIDDN